MALNASKVASSNNGSFIEQAPLDPGVYPGRLVRVIDMGLQPQRAYQGQDKPPMQEINLSYELSDEFMKDEDGEDILDKPRWVSETLPLHNLKAELAKSTKRYMALDPQEASGGDFTALLGTPINITLVQNASKGKVYANVAGIAAMRPKDAMKLPELVNEAAFFDLDDPDMEVFNSLPDWMKEKISSNLNYQGSKLQTAQKAAPVPKKEEKKDKTVKKEKLIVGSSDDDDEDRPY